MKPPSKYVKNEEMLNTRSILKIIFPFLSPPEGAQNAKKLEEMVQA